MAYLEKVKMPPQKGPPVTTPQPQARGASHPHPTTDPAQHFHASACELFQSLVLYLSVH